MPKRNFPNPEVEPFVGIHEAAQITGYGEDWIRQLCRRKMIPFYQRSRGASYQFKTSELLDWLRAGRPAP